MTDQTPPLPPRHVVLVVEDDDAVRRSLQLMLHWRGFDVRSYAAANTLLDDPESLRAECLIADYRLPDGDGVGILRALRRRGWQGRAVMVTGHPSPTLRDAAGAAGFDAVLAKPVNKHELIGAMLN